MKKTIKKISKAYIRDKGFNLDNFDIDGKISGRKFKNKKEPIFDSYGKLDRKLKGIILGEAPGKDESKEMLPFQGLAGKNLRYNLDNNGDDYWITNIVKFRPIEQTEKGYKNRTPSKEEIKISSHYLLEELVLLNHNGVKKILLVGNSALNGLLEVLERSFEKEYLVDILLEDKNFKKVFSRSNSKQQSLSTKKKIRLIKKELNLKNTVNKNIFIDIKKPGTPFKNILQLDIIQIYHTSPFNYVYGKGNEYKKKTKSIIEGIQKFNNL